MLDINHDCTTHRFCPEALHVPVHLVRNTTFVIGGASNVAKNLQSLGHDVCLISVIGSDLLGNTLQGLIEGEVAEAVLFRGLGRKTTQKYRLFVKSDLMARYDVEDTEPIAWEIDEGRSASEVMKSDSGATHRNLEAMVLAYVADRLDSFDAVVLSDYNKGVLTEGLCQTIVERCKEKGIATFVDPKPSGYTKYAGCYCFKPNLAEGQAMTGRTEVDTVLEALQGGLGCQHLVLTAGADGMYVDTVDQQVRPRRAVRLVDATGCGDTVLAVLVDGYLRGLPMVQAAAAANHVAGKCVEQVGNYVATPADIDEAILLSEPCPIIPEQRSHMIRTLFPSLRLVLTNGCFDLVHSAHIRLLQFAKRQGDLLVVAINSDESVRRLKGAGRPIQGIDERCRLMQSLEIVDFVVVFDGDTPLDVIRDLRPDVLVKGGDYAVDQIVGREYAGSVVLYDYQAGLSSSNTIRRVLTHAEGMMTSSIPL
jgi:D-beta-D-heptose 7-phosphate kinase/D-beta-D-heptose 1-phosphate adenosyltransferase